MFFVNFSSNYVQILWNDFKYEFENRNFEQILPNILSQIYEKNFYDKIFVLNWPWSFTTLRIWSVALNMLNLFKDYKIQYYSTNKINFYKQIRKQLNLPRYWLIFIWQKLNYRLYDFDADSFITQDITQLSLVEEFFVDWLSAWLLWEFDNKKVFISIQSDKLLVTYWSNKILIWIEELGIQPVFNLVPDYMISPNISQPNKT